MRLAAERCHKDGMESTSASNSDDCMLDQWTTPTEDYIMAEFPADMLMPKVQTHITNSIEHLEQPHSEVALAMRDMKKLMFKIPAGAFRLLLQAVVQPHIMLKGQ